MLSIVIGLNLNIYKHTLNVSLLASLWLTHRKVIWPFGMNKPFQCDLTGRLEERSTITLLPVRSHSGIDTFVCHDGGAPGIQLLT